MISMEIIFIALGIVVFGIVIASIFIFMRKGKNDKGNDFERFVKQTTNNLSAIDQVLSNFNDRLNDLEDVIFSQKQPNDGKKEEKYIQTKYYAYEQDGKIVIEIYKDNDVRVILPNKEDGSKKDDIENNNNNAMVNQSNGSSEKVSNAKKKILEILSQNAQKQYTYKELMELKLGGFQTLNAALNELVASGDIIKTEDKKYIFNKKS